MSKKKDKYLGLLSLFIASLALSTSIWQGIETRNHNRVSVKPILGVQYETIYNQTTVDRQPGIYLTNGYVPINCC